LNGKTVKVTAKAFVLCCHAIENARQLLASNDVMSKGVGNSDDHVGRYFMDHIHIRTSNWFPSEKFPRIYNRMFAANNDMNVNMSFTDNYTRRANMLQYYCRFNPIYFVDGTIDAGKSLRDNAFEPGDLDYLRDVGRVAREAGGIAKFMLARSGWGMPAPDYFEMEHRLDQAPNPASRVVISDRKDMLGSQIADLDWRLNDDDVRSFKNGQSIIAKEMAALGWGRFQEEEITRDLVEDRVSGHYHQIGTTRMSESPKDGVVDADCKVHGIENLYVGGSSVFPTAGYSGPTMMIIAFAMRLAEHMKGRFA
jgi:choline dehydrogenase-like flavoprotein